KGKPQDCPFRYQGQYEDTETGLYYNRFRYFDPEAGQYISQDPIGIRGGISLYAYVDDTNIQVDILGLSSYTLGQNLMKAGHTHSGLVTTATKATEWQAHHLIPEEIWNDPVNRRFFKNIKLRGRDSASNGIFLPNSQVLGDGYGFERYHLGSHTNYSQNVRRQVEAIRTRFGAQPVTPATIAQARQDIQQLQTNLHAQLNTRTGGTGCRRLT
ncbi:RHS repeat protein, partial [Hymenobacter sediminis]|uniref:RHS repeat-associated core domain-containing protein n=1 Tax=Hymenobacter sediminis TaxID=2218621 RepID=UPI00192E3F83